MASIRCITAASRLIWGKWPDKSVQKPGTHRSRSRVWGSGSTSACSGPLVSGSADWRWSSCGCGANLENGGRPKIDETKEKLGFFRLWGMWEPAAAQCVCLGTQCLIGTFGLMWLKFPSSCSMMLDTKDVTMACLPICLAKDLTDRFGAMILSSSQDIQSSPQRLIQRSLCQASYPRGLLARLSNTVLCK